MITDLRSNFDKEFTVEHLSVPYYEISEQISELTSPLKR